METHTHLGRSLSIGIVAVAAVLGGAVFYHTNYYPRTDDAEILAKCEAVARKHYPELLTLSGGTE